MLYGFSYAVLNPVWGWVADKISSTLVILIGSLLLGLGCLLIGPEWSTLIGPDPSRYCALIGCWRQSEQFLAFHSVFMA